MGITSSRTVSKSRPEPFKEPTQVEKPIKPYSAAPPVKPESKISLPVHTEPNIEVKSAPSPTPLSPVKEKSPTPPLPKNPDFASVQEVAELEKEISQVLQETPVGYRKSAILKSKESISSIPQKQLDVDGTEQMLLNEYNYFYHNPEPKISVVHQKNIDMPRTLASQPAEATPIVDKKYSDDDWEFEQKPIKGFDPEKFKAVNSRTHITGLSAEFANDLRSSCSLPATVSRKVSLEIRPKSEAESGIRELPVYDALDEALIATIEQEFVK